MSFSGRHWALFGIIIIIIFFIRNCTFPRLNRVLFGKKLRLLKTNICLLGCGICHLVDEITFFPA